jgi:FkbM family methyltransferase
MKENLIQLVKPIFKIKIFRTGLLLWHTTVNEKILGSYSQKGEDLIIEKLLKNKKKGFYIDVGANNPFDCSNTARFYKKGWHGINIEPIPKNIKEFEIKRPKDINLNIGIGTKEGSFDFYEFKEDMLSTFSKEEADEEIKKGKKLVKKHTIKIQKLSKVLDKYTKNKEIDLLSIDTEGFDFDVLKSNDWSKFKPKIICIESIDRDGTNNTGKYLKFLSKYGYDLAGKTRLNSIYMRINNE